MHYEEEEDANEFYVGHLQNLMLKLTESNKQHCTVDPLIYKQVGQLIFRHHCEQM